MKVCNMLELEYLQNYTYFICYFFSDLWCQLLSHTLRKQKETMGSVFEKVFGVQYARGKVDRGPECNWSRKKEVLNFAPETLHKDSIPYPL